MSRFVFTAIELVTGRERKGTIDGASAEAATTLLKARGFAPTQLVAEAGPSQATARKNPTTAKPGPRRSPIMFGRIVTPKKLATFTRQLAMLLKAGMPCCVVWRCWVARNGSPFFVPPCRGWPRPFARVATFPKDCSSSRKSLTGSTSIW